MAIPPSESGQSFAMVGKPQVFSDEENATLRAELRALKNDRGLSQAAVGRLIGVGQPTAGKLLGTRHAGMSRATANALARALNFRDAEELLLDRGALAAMKQPPTGAAWGNRDTAVRIAQHLKYDQAAIHAIVTRYPDDDYRTRSVKWWMIRFGEEETRMRADEPHRHPPLETGIKRATDSSSVLVPTKKRRPRTAG